MVSFDLEYRKTHPTIFVAIKSCFTGPENSHHFCEDYTTRRNPAPLHRPDSHNDERRALIDLRDMPPFTPYAVIVDMLNCIHRLTNTCQRSASLPLAVIGTGHIIGSLASEPVRVNRSDICTSYRYTNVPARAAVIALLHEPLPQLCHASLVEIHSN